MAIADSSRTSGPAHARLFDFESEFVETLRCIPIAVRFKLDRVEIKLTLRQWIRMGLAARQDLLARPCESPSDIVAYRGWLVKLLEDQGEKPRRLSEPSHALRACGGEMPSQVIDFAEHRGVPPLSNEDWAGLSELERFALLKLSRDNHDNVNFVPALREFGVLRLDPLLTSRGEAR